MCIDEWLTPFSGQVPGHRRGTQGCRLRRVTEVTAVVGWLSGPQREREARGSFWILFGNFNSERGPSIIFSLCPPHGFSYLPQFSISLDPSFQTFSPPTAAHKGREPTAQSGLQHVKVSWRIAPSNPTGHFLFLPHQTFLCSLRQTAGSLPEHKGLLIKLFH